MASTYGLGSVEELITLLREHPHYELEKAVCDAMVTVETFFFRDGVPFEMLRTVIVPELAARCRVERRALRVWSAATATGQEAYSLAMLFDQLDTVLRGVRVEFLATDFATHNVTRGRRGAYNQLEVQRGLAPELLERYFTKRGDEYMITDALRRRVTFAEFNLLDSFAVLGKFDVILCRNVLLYFDSATKKNVMERMADVLLPGGYFFLGSTETSFGVTERLIRIPNAPTTVHMRAEDLPNAGRQWPTRSSAA